MAYDYDDDYNRHTEYRWNAAFDEATDAVMLILPGNDRGLVREAIELAHQNDDPDWRFQGEALIETLMGDVDDDDVYEQLDALFPVTP